MKKTIRDEIEAFENAYLSPYAARSADAARAKKEPPCPIRTAFQRDRDRVLHSKSFRRLKHKTQVFFSPEGDHYRTRMTHTLEVSQIARTIARSMHLNEDLAEAISLAHDLGHPPFGHTGEKALNEITKGRFNHHLQSLRIVEKLENGGRGLNLTEETKNGILVHSKGKSGKILQNTGSLTLEADIVRAADIIAYVNHDADDAIRAGLIRLADIPKKYRKLLGDTTSARLRNIVLDVVKESKKANGRQIKMSEPIYDALVGMRAFLYERVYENKKLVREHKKIENLLFALYEYIFENYKNFTAPYPTGASVEERTIDFIAGMTDQYALNIFFPKGWKL